MYKEVEDIFKKSLNYDIIDIELIGGMTNTNFLVTSTQGQFVVRIPGAKSNLMIDRVNEKINQNMACKFDFNVPTLFFDEKSGVKITKFIKNTTTLKQNTIANHFNLIAPMLKEIHKSNMVFNNNFNPFEEMNRYLLLIEDSKLDLFKEFKFALELFFNLEQKLKYINQKIYKKDNVLVPTHGDLVPENILFCDGRIYIIDWEYSGLNDPCWDIASLFVEMGDYANKDLEDKFLKLYGLNDKEIPKIEIYKSVQDILWVAWSLAKISSGVDYYDYAKFRLQNALCREGL